MKKARYCSVALVAMATALAAESPDHAAGPSATAAPVLTASSSRSTFQQYCVMCHGGDQPQAGLSLARLTEKMAPADVGEHADSWQKVAEMLESRQMPPVGIPAPSDAERASLVNWINTSLGEYDAGHG